MIKNQLTKEEILALPPIIDLPTAGRAFGKGRTKSYELARADEFPCQVLPLGAHRFVVTKVALLKALEMDDTKAGAA